MIQGETRADDELWSEPTEAFNTHTTGFCTCSMEGPGKLVREILGTISRHYSRVHEKSSPAGPSMSTGENTWCVGLTLTPAF